VALVQNPRDTAVSGHIHFWSTSGALLVSHPFTLPAHTTLALNTATLPVLQGAGGSLTVSHEAPYGALMGKAVALEPATGFSFDSPLEPRP
jgi:hypothetical protein